MCPLQLNLCQYPFFKIFGPKATKRKKNGVYVGVKKSYASDELGGIFFLRWF